MSDLKNQFGHDMEMIARKVSEGQADLAELSQKVMAALTIGLPWWQCVQVLSNYGVLLSGDSRSFSIGRRQTPG